jgi:hypothetical protein
MTPAVTGGYGDGDNVLLRVFATVGTDCHPFDRLVTWMDAWAAQAGSRAKVVVQHGSSRAPAVAEAIDFLPHDALREEISSSDVVVSHGGPATQSRSAGAADGSRSSWRAGSSWKSTWTTTR